MGLLICQRGKDTSPRKSLFKLIANPFVVDVVVMNDVGVVVVAVVVVVMIIFVIIVVVALVLGLIVVVAVFVSLLFVRLD